MSLLLAALDHASRSHGVARGQGEVALAPTFPARRRATVLPWGLTMLAGIGLGLSGALVWLDGSPGPTSPRVVQAAASAPVSSSSPAPAVSLPTQTAMAPPPVTVTPSAPVPDDATPPEAPLLQESPPSDISPGTAMPALPPVVADAAPAAFTVQEEPETTVPPNGAQIAADGDGTTAHLTAAAQGQVKRGDLNGAQQSLEQAWALDRTDPVARLIWRFWPTSAVKARRRWRSIDRF